MVEEAVRVEEVVRSVAACLEERDEQASSGCEEAVELALLESDAWERLCHSRSLRSEDRLDQLARQRCSLSVAEAEL